jgi:fructan beta-fructosidase
MRSTKHLPLLFYSSLLFSITGCIPSSIMGQGSAASITSEREEQLYRPNFHYTPKKGWMNDPNGMFYSNGKYHLFYQYYPDDSVWGPMHWGHAVSKDLIKWEELPIALYPDNKKYIISGSAVVDTKNTSGLGKDKQVPIVAIYTQHDADKEKQGAIDAQNQDLAYSLDDGLTWRKFDEGNPIIKNPGIKDFRDPKVSWDVVHNQWIMVLAAQDKVQFYKSSNLKSWEYLSDFGKNIGGHGGVWECPDFFEIKVEGTNEKKWVLIQNLNPGGANGGSGVQYFVGGFDGKTFTLDTEFAKKVSQEKAIWLDYGKDNYAGVTWNNIPDSDGRRLFIGWMSNWDYAEKVPTMAWRSSNTIAREIQLIKKGNAYSLISNPVKEINKYISKSVNKESLKGKGILPLVEAGKIDLSQTMIDFKLTNLKQDSYTFTLSNKAGETLSFGINNSEGYLFVDRSKAGRVDFSEKFASAISKANLEKNLKEAVFKIILDKTSIEIFYNNGEKVITEIFFPTQPFTEISASSNQGIEISNLVMSQINVN